MWLVKITFAFVNVGKMSLLFWQKDIYGKSGTNAKRPNQTPVANTKVKVNLATTPPVYLVKSKTLTLKASVQPYNERSLVFVNPKHGHRERGRQR